MTQNTGDAGSAEQGDGRERALSMNQIVSYNMLRARRSEGWTQQDVADQLERYTGRGWSNASVSAAERAWQGGRSRRFDASEIVCLAKIFDKPVAYFFLPPDGDEGSKWAGMKEFSDNRPIVDPLDRHHDLHSLISTKDLVGLIDGTYSPEFRERLRRLTEQYVYGLSSEQRARRVELPLHDGSRDGEQFPSEEDSYAEWREKWHISDSVLKGLVKEHSHGIAAEITAILDQKGYLARPDEQAEER